MFVSMKENVKKIWNIREFRILCLVAAVISVLCVIRMILPARTYEYTVGSGKLELAPYVDETGEEPSLEITLRDHISLPVGVWRVHVDYETDMDMASSFFVRDESLPSTALQCIGEHTYLGLKQSDFVMYLFAPTKTLELYLVHSNDTLTVGNVTFRETIWYQTRILTLVWALVLLVFLILLLKERAGRSETFAEKKKYYYAVTLIGLLAASPFFLGAIVSGGDMLYHLIRIEGVKDTLLSGIFPVRIEPKWLQGWGYADAIFYCPFFLYIPGILRTLGFTVVEAYSFYCILFCFATAWTAYLCFRKIFEDDSVGVLCSALYTLSIYRFYRGLYEGAIGETTAYTFFPLILYGLWKILVESRKDEALLQKQRFAFMPLAAGFSGLVMCHVLSSEIVFFILVLTALVFIDRLFSKGVFKTFFKAGLWALGFCMWFLVPFADYYLNQEVRIKHAFARTIQYRGNYLGQMAHLFWRNGDSARMYMEGMIDSAPMSIGLMLLACLLAYFLFLIAGKLRDVRTEERRFDRYTAFLGAFLVLMSMSFFPWDIFQRTIPFAKPFISSLQFPFRLLGFGSVCAAYCGGRVLLTLKRYEEDKTGYHAAIAAVLAGTLASGIFLANVTTANGGMYALYNDEGFSRNYISGSEYLPEDTEQKEIHYNRFEASPGVTLGEKETGALRASVNCHNPQGETGWIEVPLIFYKGYHAYDGEKKELPVTAGTYYTVRVEIPEGFLGNVTVLFKEPWYWRLAELFSALVIAGTILRIVLPAGKRSLDQRTENES